MQINWNQTYFDLFNLCCAGPGHATNVLMQRKKHIRDNFNYEMANVLQNAYRGYKARGLVLEMKRERAAVVRVQSGIRCSLAKTLVSEKREQRRAAIKLQSRVRVSFSQKEVEDKRREKHAAVLIQCASRNRKAKRAMQRMRPRRQWQRRARGASS